MPRTPVYILFYLALAATVSPTPQAAAQQQAATQRQKAAEFTRLWERLEQTKDPDERIALANQALKLEPALHQWPLKLARDEVQGRLWLRLGQGYAGRSAGEKAERIERAIAAYDQALRILARAHSPKLWEAHAEIAFAYRGRIHGDRADNVEKAIEAFQTALAVEKGEATASKRAVTYYGLGGVFSDRIHGVRADNLEKAIAAYETSLSVGEGASTPGAWASTQNDLGNAYLKRIHGLRADNLEKTIAAFEAALTHYTREAKPRPWVMIQTNLAAAYIDRIRGARADNVEKAIALLEETLTVHTRETMPDKWGHTQHNLATAYLSRIHGVRAENLEKAIAGFEAALTVSTREAEPLDWAATQFGLAQAHALRIHGARPDNIEKAITNYKAALTVRTREALPREWAQTQNELGLAYLKREARADNLSKAIAAFEAALTVATRDALPRDHLRIARLLGFAHLEAGQSRKADLAYASARDAYLLLFGQGLDDAEARDLVASTERLFTEAAFSAALGGQLETALTLSMEGRARLMAVVLNLQKLDLPAEKRRRVDELRAAIRNAQRTVDAAMGTERAAAVERLVSLRQELLDLVKSATTTDNTAGSTLALARAVLTTGGAIAVPILTEFGAKILIVTPGATRNITVHDLPELTTSTLGVLVRGDASEGRTGGWLGAYNINYLPEADMNTHWPQWLDAVGKLGPELWRLIGRRLHAALKERGVKLGERVVWFPTHALGILPLGLAQDPRSERRLADDYEIIYAQSLEALVAAQNQIAKNTAPTLAVIINPTGDLIGTEDEGALVASYFPSTARQVLMRGAATPDAVLAALKGKSYWHFASHATFSWNHASSSALLMHGPAPLSVGRLLETDGLGRPRLVVLSACETGLYDIERNPDEFIGLPATFTALGAAGVLGTLWPVSDAATALLIAKFYELHVGQKLPPPTALARAQVWLRRATNADLQDYARAAANQGTLDSRQIAKIEQELSLEKLRLSRNNAVIEWMEPDPAAATTKKIPNYAPHLVRPYAHPYFWAGFIHTGL